MRIKFKFKGSNTLYEYNNLKQTKGWFEDNVIGRNNELHNKFSNYALSPMQGGSRNGKYVSFPNGGYVIFSTIDEELFSLVISNIWKLLDKHTKVGDLEYDGFDFMRDFESDIHKDYDIIQTISPILLKKSDGYMTFMDNGFLDELSNRSKKRLIVSGIDEQNANTLKFELFHPENASVVNMQYVSNNMRIQNKCSKVKLIVRGDKNARLALYSMGIGCSTGCGFGTIEINKKN